MRWQHGLMAVAVLPGLAWAQTTVGDIERGFVARDRINAGLPDVSPGERQRAGFYAGYVDAVRERLAATGQACPNACRCYADTAIESALFDAPDPGQPAAAWLDAVLIRALPCP
jgi:hypothetical protein